MNGMWQMPCFLMTKGKFGRCNDDLGERETSDVLHECFCVGCG